MEQRLIFVVVDEHRLRIDDRHASPQRFGRTAERHQFTTLDVELEQINRRNTRSASEFVDRCDLDLNRRLRPGSDWMMAPRLARSRQQ